MSENNTSNPVIEQDESDAPDIGRYRNLSVKWRVVMAILTTAATFLAINQIFALGFFVGNIMLDSRYLYLVTGIMLSMVFITFPSHKSNLDHVPWYDIVIIANGRVAIEGSTDDIRNRTGCDDLEDAFVHAIRLVEPD